ncbi:oligosaccharide flippase family protein [Marinomonas communis]|uniref:oligosaccharide flippase family protein n=1 Tax=Marinomonas communis TaxID=28254 RepID=UPI001D17E63F|nr:oligosaccharide flippase family protein [Marinomonas communis]MCC4275237.1 oligosaccharide flippase family protein [Marinomonas communis]
MAFYKNLSYMFVVQIANYLIPLLMFPYLIRTVGVDGFGKFNYALTITMILFVLSDFGFNLTAVRDISENKSNRYEKSKIFISVFIVRLIIVLIILISSITFAFIINEDSYWLVVYFLGMLIGQTLMPTWYFQGEERMFFSSVCSLLSKLVSAVLIFLFVSSETDLWLAPFAYSIGGVIGLIISIYFVINFFDLEFIMPGRQYVWEKVQGSFFVFMTNIVGNTYVLGSVIILGLFVNDRELGFFSISQKITVVIISFFQVFSQVIFPFLARKKDLVNSGWKRYVTYSSLMCLICYTLFYITGISDLVYLYFSGGVSQDGLEIFDWYLVLSTIISINVLINPIVLVFRGDRKLFRYSSMASCAFFILSYVFVPEFSSKGMIVVLFLVEFFILLMSIKFLSGRKVIN